MMNCLFSIVYDLIAEKNKIYILSVINYTIEVFVLDFKKIEMYDNSKPYLLDIIIFILIKCRKNDFTETLQIENMWRSLNNGRAVNVVFSLSLIRFIFYVTSFSFYI